MEKSLCKSTGIFTVGSKNMGIVMGLDLGTTSISGVILDTEKGQLLEHRTIPGGHFLKGDAPWERMQDPDEIVEKALVMAEELYDLHTEICAVGVDCQMHGILYIDRDGNAISPLFTWQDGRGEVTDKDENNVISEIKEKTGCAVPSGYGLATHIYNLRHGLVPEKTAGLCTIGDYLVLKMTGNTECRMHSSNGAGLGFFDVEKGVFRLNALKKMQIDCSLLPVCCDGTETEGNWKGIPVSMAIGDNQASFLGAVGSKMKKLLVNIGTGSQISMLTDHYVEIPGMETRPFYRNQYLLVGASLCGGRAYAMLERFFRTYAEAFMNTEDIRSTDNSGYREAAPQYNIMEQLARKASSSHGITVHTQFCGTRDNPQLRGSVEGIGEDNFYPGEWILGTMEGMVRELWTMYEKMKQKTGIFADEIIASGNGIRRNDLLRELAEQQFELEVHLSECEEEAACGAAVFAQMCVC